jgi:penicillin-binding protein 1C
MRKLIKPVHALFLALSLGMASFYFYIQRPMPMPGFHEVRESYRSSEAALLDRHGEVIHERRVDDNGRRLDWVDLGMVSPALIKAVVASEDRRFYGHRGLDWRAVASAFIGNLTARNIRGASTITMQLATQIKDGARPNGRKNLSRKIIQIRQAVSLERDWSKNEILEAYLNLVAFRGELRGVAAASLALFGKDPHGLTDTESIILASLIRSPNAGADAIVERADRLARSMGINIDASLSLNVKEALATPHFSKPLAAIAPHVAARLLKHGQKAGVVTTTIDARLQGYAIEVLRQHLKYVSPQNVKDGAVLVVDNRTGDVLAYVGSSGELSGAKFVDGVIAERQAGSTLKPFLYAEAFEKKVLTAASIIDDSPLDIPVVGGLYRPHNYDSSFKGFVTARTSLASSLNVPAVKTLNLVGNATFLKTLKGLGIEGLEDDDYYGPSLALGSADVSLWELVNAYRTIANGGVWSELRLTPRADKARRWRRIFSKEASFIVTDILSDRVARSQTFGLENPLSTRFRSAVKTGTSKDMRDNWCIGFTDRFTVGVWVGNFSGEPMWDVSGITGAAPVWLDIMNWLHGAGDTWAPRPPSGLTARNVKFDGIEPARMEWFVKGTEPAADVEPLRGQKTAKITYPVGGTIIALDPDIPDDRQAVFFETGEDMSGLRWVLNGRNVGGGTLMMWHPSAGKYTLTLSNSEGQALDSISFEVKGRTTSHAEY